MKRYCIIFLFLILSGNLPLRAEELSGIFENQSVSVSFSAASGRLQGNTTYHIDFPGGASELEFPLNTTLSGFWLEFLISKADAKDKQPRSRFTVTWLMNSRYSAGDMKDSDWIADDVGYFTTMGWPGGYNQPGLDIYSESEAELMADISDIQYEYNFSPAKNITLGSFIGYRFQKFEYDVFNTNQVGFGPYAPYFTTSVPGLTLEYDVAYKFLYLGLNVNCLLNDRLLIKGRYGYSNNVNVTDTDDHVLRSKLSKAKTDGSVSLTNIDINWNFSPGWSLQAGYESGKIDTEGTQKQIYYGGPSAGWSGEVNDEITSSYQITSLSIKYQF